VSRLRRSLIYGIRRPFLLRWASRGARCRDAVGQQEAHLKIKLASIESAKHRRAVATPLSQSGSTGGEDRFHDGEPVLKGSRPTNDQTVPKPSDHFDKFLIWDGALLRDRYRATGVTVRRALPNK
jgi:hypothetical protein